MCFYDALQDGLPRVGLCGRRGVGKSHLLAALSNRDLIGLSHVEMVELPLIGSASFMICPTINEGEGFATRARDGWQRCFADLDLVILVIDFARGIGQSERDFLAALVDAGLSCVIVYNKADTIGVPKVFDGVGSCSVAVSAALGENVEALKLLVADVLSGAKGRDSQDCLSYVLKSLRGAPLFGVQGDDLSV